MRLFGPQEEVRAILTDDDPLETEIAAFLAAIRDGPDNLPVTPMDAVAGLEVAGMILAALEAT